MRIFLFFLALLFSIHSNADDSNISFGKYGNASGYNFEGGKEDMGRLIIFTCGVYDSCNVPYPLTSMTPYFLIRINGKQLAEIYGDDYFDVNIPIGLYNVEIIEYNDFGEDSVAMSYEVLIKGKRSITIYTRNQRNGPYTSVIMNDPQKLIDTSIWGVKWKKAQIDEQSLSRLTSEYFNNVKDVKAKEDEAIAYALKTNEQIAQKSKKEYEESINRAAEVNEKQAQKLRSARQVETQQENDKKNAETQKREANEALLTKKNAEELKDQSKADDTTCKSYGAKFGSSIYVQCRTQLTSQRRDSMEHQIKNEVLEKKIDELQNQLITQQQMISSSVSRSSQINNNEIAFQKEQLAIQQEQLRVLKAQNERAKAESALRYIQQQNNPGLWGNPTNVRIVP